MAERKQIKSYIASPLSQISSARATSRGDTASSRTICFNPMVLGGDQNQIMFCGLWYDDEFIRTPEGWRMSRRVEAKVFDKII